MPYLRRATATWVAPAEPIAPPPTLEISHSTIAEAMASGTAVTLTAAITDFVHYDDVWWLRDRDHWLRITDVVLVADLDAFKIRLDGP